MNLQQSINSKPSANGFGRRRGDRDVGTKFENKFQPGKSNPNRLTNTSEFHYPFYFFVKLTHT